MKKNFWFSTLCVLLGMAVLVGTAALAFWGREQPVQLLFSSGRGEVCTEKLMEALCGGDWGRASVYLYGQPELLGEADSPFVQILWENYRSGLDYSFSGGCYPGENGLCRDVVISYPDMEALLGKIQPAFRKALTARAETDDPGEMYDENRAYREEYLQAVLQDTARQLLEAEGEKRSTPVTLRLIFQDGAWQVLPEQSLMDILSGGMGD